MPQTPDKITVALAGNPNSGKSTIFNMLTGARQHVANYPGVTVEIKYGKCTHNGIEINIVDLPGTYSLTAYTPEELVARNFIIEQKPDVVVDIIDSSNVERHLYLATQLIEINAPLVLAFNMSDIAQQKGMLFDTKQLSRLLQAKIVHTVGNKQKGKPLLLDAITRCATQPQTPRTHNISYGREIEEEITKIDNIIQNLRPQIVKKYNPRWLAIKLLEQDEEIIKIIQNNHIRERVEKSVHHLRTIFADEPETIIADRRYGFISGACEETVKKTVEWRHSASDAIDTIVTNRILGLPIFLLLMLSVFILTFKIGQYPMDWLEQLFEFAAKNVAYLWPQNSSSWIKSLILDGIIGGVGQVVVLLPYIILLFLAIALLEGSGYMSRAAFVMDRIMHKIGLHGKSFIPMLIGFGCSVPAIMATRILENKRNRLTTIMVIPLMSCGARLAVYTLITAAFFQEKWRGPILWLIYIIGIILAVISAKILRMTVFRGETTPFVMELSPYRMPTIKALLIHMWQRAWLFLRKAGTIILAFSIILWAAASYPKPSQKSIAGLSKTQIQQKELQYSAIGRLGCFIQPAIKPLGFDWKIGTALIAGIAAKEIFVAQIGIVYAVQNPSEDSPIIHQKIRRDYSPLTGFCIMLFSLISAPCIATIAMTKQETASWKLALFQFAALTTIAYLVTLCVYQIGSLLTA